MITKLTAPWNDNGPDESFKCTAKHFAQEVLKAELCSIVAYWQERYEYETQHMTEEELSKVQAEMSKMCQTLIDKLRKQTEGV